MKALTLSYPQNGSALPKRELVDVPTPEPLSLIHI